MQKRELTNSVELSTTWEVTSCEDTQELPSPLHLLLSWARSNHSISSILSLEDAS
jgi:hypothetical protein